MKESIYWIWLQSRFGYASPLAARAVRELGGAAEIYREGTKNLPFLSLRLNEALDDKRLDAAAKIADYCAVKHIGIITYEDESYPSQLRALEDPPMVLYVRGRLPDMNRELCIAVVGTREMSDYGMLQSYRFGYGLAYGGALVVSGMALGSDGAAAAGALDALKPTVAVLGCGVDICYPSEHKKLMGEIISSGAVISEYAPGEKGSPARFPERNRIISGLCRGTLVTEAGEASGALITARAAIKQGRALYAVPGKIGESGSSGPNALIKEGASAVTSGFDIIREYAFLYPDRISLKKPEEIPDENIIFAMATHGVSWRAKPGSAKNRRAPEPLTAEDRAKARTKTEFITSRSPAKEEREIKINDGEKADIEKKLSLMDEETREIYKAIPKDRSFSPEEDALAAFEIGDVLCALTVMEVNGLVKALPGGRYTVN